MLKLTEAQHVSESKNWAIFLGGLGAIKTIA